MKYAPHIAATLLGLLFLMASGTFFLGMVPEPEFPPGSPIAAFMEAFGPTGYMTFVKSFELLGGILVILPKTRNLGLLILGPIIVNIIAFHAFVAKSGLFDPMLLAICFFAVFLLWTERAKWKALVG